MKKRILVYIVSSCIALSSLGQVNYQWVKSVGSSGSGEGGLDVSVDNHGYIYVVGKRGGGTIDFNIYGTPAWDLTNSATSCFVAKYDSTGNCVWAKDFQPIGSSGSVGTSVVTDAIGNVYVGGSFLGTVDFDPSFTNVVSLSSVDTSNSPTIDGFLAKFNSNGDYQWAKTVGGKGVDLITSVVVDPSGIGVYVSGTFTSDTAVFTTITDTLFNKGDMDGFVAGFETSTGSTSWFNVIGGLGNDAIVDIDADNSYLVVTGFFNDSAVFFNQFYNQDTLYAQGGEGTNAFYGKYTLPNGDYGWMNKIGGAGSTSLGTSVTFKNNSEIYLTGGFNGTIEVDPSNPATTLVSAGGKDVFLCKYDIGGVYNWSKRIGSENSNANNTVVSRSISVDENENTYIAGYFSGIIDFNASGISDYPDTSTTGGADFYFSKYDNMGEIVWSKKISSNLTDTLVSIAVDDKFDIYLTGGYTDTIDFNLGAGVAKRSSLGYEDMFLVKYAQGMATIRGTVFYKDANNNLDSLRLASAGKKVRLYTQIQFDGNNALNLIAETDIDTLGKYKFTEIPDGQYLAYAIPGDDYSLAQLLIPTYYTSDLNNDTAFLWEAATMITTVSTAPAFVANIHMAKGMPLTGNATLGGVILAEEGYFREVKPIAGGIVVVRKNPGNALVANTETDEYGFYSFNNLSAVTNDTCYRLYVNIAGLPMVSNYSPRPGQGESIMDLNFVVDSATIDTVASIVNSVSQIKTLKTPLTVYPNPNNGSVTIEFTITDPLHVSIEVYNMLGEKVVTLLDENKNSGLIQYKYNASDKGLNAGVYFLNIQIGNELITRKVVQMD